MRKCKFKIFDVGKSYKRLEFGGTPQPVSRLATVPLPSVSGKALGAVEGAVALWKTNAVGALQVCLPGL